MVDRYPHDRSGRIPWFPTGDGLYNVVRKQGLSPVGLETFVSSLSITVTRPYCIPEGPEQWLPPVGMEEEDWRHDYDLLSGRAGQAMLVKAVLEVGPVLTVYQYYSGCNSNLRPATLLEAAYLARHLVQLQGVLILGSHFERKVTEKNGGQMREVKGAIELCFPVWNAGTNTIVSLLTHRDMIPMEQRILLLFR